MDLIGKVRGRRENLEMKEHPSTKLTSALHI